MIASWQEINDKPRQCVEKQRRYSADKGPYSQSYGLPSGHIWLWSWTIKKAEHQRIDAFELWCWRRLLKVSCTTRRSKQSILRELNPEYSLEGLMPKHQYLGHLMKTDDSFVKFLMLEKIDGRMRRGCQRMRWLNGGHHQCNEHELGKTPGDGEGQGLLGCCRLCICKELNTTG